MSAMVIKRLVCIGMDVFSEGRVVMSLEGCWCFLVEGDRKKEWL